MQCFGWSPADLSRKTGLKYATIDGYLSGRRIPEVEACVRLVQALNFPSIEHLLFGRPRAEWNELREPGGRRAQTDAAAPPGPE